MVETWIYQINKKIRSKLSLYINIVMFFIIALFIYLLIVDVYEAGKIASSAAGGDILSQAWIYITRDIVFVAIGLTWVFFQFFKNQLLIMRKSW